MNYKKNQKLLLVIVIAIIVISGFSVFFKPSVNKTRQNVINSEKIKIGMTKIEVIKIMGKPDDKRMSFFGSKDTMYYYEPPFAASEGIYIQFEDSSKKVNHIIPYE